MSSSCQRVRGAKAAGVRSLSALLMPGRYTFVHYGLSPLGLSFTQANQEIDYQAVLLTATVAHIRFALLLAMIIIAAFGIVDSFIYKPSTVLFYALVIRFIIVLPAAVMLFMITFHSRYIRYVRVVGVCGICAVGLGFGLIAYSSTVLTLIYTYPAIVMTTIYAFFFVGLFFRYAIVAATLTNLIYSVAIWTTDIPEAMRIAACISMITLLLMLAMAAYQKELISRQLFISETRERESIARQRQSDHRYLTWLRQLASFLRHEVRQPVAQINSSIEIVQLACKADDHLKPYLASAALGAQHVWNLVERASQATDAEAFVRNYQPQWTNLTELLRDQVDAYRQICAGIDFQCYSPLLIRAYADPTLIKEAVGNLLSNAASFAQEESTVEATIELEGQCATIKVTNTGPLIDGDAESLFGPFASTRASLSSEHQGFGLYMVRLIAEQHGGTATIRDLQDGSGVQASITLPVIM